MAEVPHEQELLPRWGRRELAIVGVNADQDMVAARRACAEKGVSWRSFWDRGPDGPIGHPWNNHAWPTFYVIDAAGVIRAKGDELRSTLRYQKPDGTLDHEVRVLDQTLERLMNEAADKKKP